MCFTPKVPKDHSAEQAAAAEAARQKAIKTGVGNIDQAFSGFNDGYFNNYANDYEKNYTPQVQDQYQDARRKLILSLARTGNLTSSEGASQLGDIKEALGTQQAGIRSQANAAADALRNNVETRRSNLLQLNTEAADPAMAGSGAASAAASLTASPTYAPLGDLFAGFLKMIPQGVAAEQAGYKGLGTGLFSQPAGSSVKVVG